MKYLIALLACASISFGASSTKQPVVFNHALRAGAGSFRAIAPRVFSAQGDTITVVAARVDFKIEVPDDPFTTGLGVFDTSDPSPKYLDAPPHDTGYFDDHLTFLTNYFDTVSRGKLAVKTILLPNKASVANTMGTYAPPQGSTDNKELAQLVSDAWTAAAAANPQFSFSSLDPSRTFFVIFHAGVGRDVDLSSTYGYNPQPQDLPSLYFDLNALQNALGGSFNGVPVDGGNFLITNSAVIPETETRTVNGAQLVLGTNALLASSLGSYLGLPDLYNTTNDYTAIGRFGLEDIASIFAFAGAIPPEPCAWEKMYLGWMQPVELHPIGTQSFSLVAPQAASNTDTTIARLSINSREYFLLENRERNPGGGGITCYYTDTNRTHKKFTTSSDGIGFNPGDIFTGLSADVTDIRGTLTACSNYDWAAAGSGILIWHVDQNIIDQYASTGAVNGAGHTRGVHLMEADGGSLQIGVPIQTILGTTIISEGYDGNTWHRGNQSNFPLYKNEFSDFTQPNAQTNNNTPSGFRVFNFDTNKTRMNFQVQVGGTGIKLTNNFPQRLNGSPGTNPVVTADIDGSGKDAIFLATPNALLAWKADGTKLIANSDSVAIFAFPVSINVAPSIDSVSQKVVALARQAQGSNMYIWLYCWSPQDKNNDGLADTVFQRLIMNGYPRSLTVPMIENGKIIFAADSMIYEYDETGNLLFKQSAHVPVTAIAATDSANIIVVDGSGQSIAELDVPTGQFLWTRNIAIGGNTSLSVGDMNNDSKIEIAVTSDNGNTLLLDDQGNIINTLTLKTPSDATLEADLSAHGILVDVDGRGDKELIAAGAQHLFAQNIRNASVSNFPIAVGGVAPASPISGEPSAALNGTAVPSLILLPTSDGLCHGIVGNTGKEYPGFPLSVGNVIYSTPAITQSQLVIATPDKYLFSYDLGFKPGAGWTQYLHDAQHTSYNGTSTPQASAGEFFPKSRVYNWPNPVRNKFTHIRFYVSENATMHIRIVDLANELVETLPDYQATGGIDNEVELHTDGIQSGVYIVRVEADAADQKDVAFIKMAIVN
ncbi:MAG TPA: hypothetical protein VFJ29_04745 [Candidatus Kapabacteria bacterium]|nr:hypothetical protein [Candidatus Kapabacteria bacterium]